MVSKVYTTKSSQYHHLLVVDINELTSHENITAVTRQKAEYNFLQRLHIQSIFKPKAEG